MKDTARYQKRGFTLVPADRAGRELHAGLKEGVSFFVQLWRPRNMAQHRKYFAVLNNVVEASGDWASTEDLRFEIFKALKRGTIRVSVIDGSVDFIPDSMAVASMPKAEFERLYEDTMKLLAEWLGCDPELILEQAA